MAARHRPGEAPGFAGMTDPLLYAASLGTPAMKRDLYHAFKVTTRPVHGIARCEVHRGRALTAVVQIWIPKHRAFRPG